MDYQTQRKFMVEQQLAGRGITDKAVLDAFFKVERHKFVPEKLLGEAYSDYPLPIGEGQTISQPYIVALMTQLLALTKKDKVLEIGVGSGYQTAILAELAGSVYAVEWFPGLAKSAELRLKEMGYLNTHIKTGDGTLGWPDEAPFERMLIAAAAPAIPGPLLDQLAETGILVMPVGGMFSQMLTMTKKLDGKIDCRDIYTCAFVPLLGRHGA